MSRVNVVVGGGIAGIVSAHYLRKLGKEVVLVEKSEVLGGLLRSKDVEGRYFDFGTHILGETGISELDEFFFGGLDYKRFDYLKYGSYHGSLYEGNGFLTDDSLTNNQRKEGLQELVSISKNPNPESYSFLADQIEGDFGRIYGDLLIKPVIQKLFFQEADTLEPNAHHLFGLSRLICDSAERSRELKKNDYLNSKIAFHSYKEGLSALKGIYPLNNGAGAWISLLEEKLIAQGVQILKGEDFKISGNGARINSLITSEFNYEVDNIYWTVPPIFLLSALGIDKPKFSPPQRLSTVVVDLLLEGDYNTGLYYFQVYDPQLKSFRVTCYDNFNPESNPDQTLKRLSVEFLSNDVEIDTNKYKILASKELVLMNIVSSEKSLRVVNIDIVKGGFPIPTPDFRSATEAQVSKLESIQNLKLFGKATGRVWFMADVMMEIHKYFQVSETRI